MPCPVRHTFLVHTLLILAFCLLPLSARAATLNVPAQYATIQAGINAARNGDTVLVAYGTYTGDGNRDVDLSGKSITVKSVHGATKTIINCEGTDAVNHRGFYLANSSTIVVINGFTIENGYASGHFGTAGGSIDGGGIDNGAGSANILNCILINNTADIGGGIFTASYNDNQGHGTTSLISGCVFTHNNAHFGGGLENDTANGAIVIDGCTFSSNTAVYGGGAVFNENGSTDGTITMNNCLFTGNSAGYYGGAAENQNDYQNTNGIIALNNCTLFANTAPANGGCVYDNNRVSSGVVIYTNVIIYNDTGGEIVTDRSIGSDIIRFCDVQGGYAGTGNINADPLFVNAASGDFHLRAGSPVIGKGVAVSGVTTDKDGVTRPNPPAIGAYEFVAPTHTFTTTHVAAGLNGSGVLLWNSANGAAFVQTLAANGATTRSATFGPYAGASAKAVAVAPDGSLRLLWTNTNGAVAVWSLTAAGAVTSYGTSFGPYSGSTATGMTVTADGKTRLLWTNMQGAAQVWTLDTIGRATAYGPTFGPYGGGSHVAAIGGGADGKIRLLWTNSTNAASVWLLNANAAVVSYGATYGPYTGAAALSVSGGADGKTRLLWKNSTNAAAVWTLSSTGSVLSYGQTYGPYSGAGAYDLSVGSDNVTRLLWANTSGQAQVWSIAPTGALTYSPNLGPF